MLLKIVCLLMRWLFGLTVRVFRGGRAKNAELLVLRHENAVLRRHAGRIRYVPADRVGCQKSCAVRKLDRVVDLPVRLRGWCGDG